MADSGGRNRGTTAAIDRTTRLARLLLTAERLTVALTPFLAVLGLIVSLALFGLWQTVAAPWAFGLTALALAALVASLLPLRAFRQATIAEARRRVELRSGFVHRPVETLADTLGPGQSDDAIRRLWTAHQARAREAVDSARSGAFEPGVAQTDPFALRAIPALLLFVSVLFAQGDAADRLKAVIAPQSASAAAVAVRVDAWVTPPVYTGEPPLFLTRPVETGGEATQTANSYSVPDGSVLTVRVTPGDDATLSRTDTEARTEIDGQATASAPGRESPTTFETEIAATTVFDLATGEDLIRSWAFEIIPDSPPTIAFKDEPQTALSGALTLSYTMADDYGVAAARADIRQVETGDGKKAGRPLYTAPELPLMLPQARVRDGEGSTVRDLQAHPWAGSDVTITLEAQDEAGQTGRSDAVAMTLPQRAFREPLARAIVEQRRILALDGDAVVPVASALDALTFGADRFFDEINHYLVMRSAYWRLQNARDDDDLRGVVDYLWEIALFIEDGDLSLAERRLRAAQQALMDALENNASDEEIERLMAELRQAMNEFLRELAQNAEQMPQGAEMPPMDPSQMLSSEDLDRMLDRIEEMAKSGARDAARQMLSEMQRMMENLRNARRMPQQNGGESEMSEALRELQEMIQRQQELMDQTFQMQRQQDQNGQQGGQQPQPGQNGQMPSQEQLGELGRGQQALREQLEQLMQQLGEMGMGENPNLGQAGEAMGEAEGNLRGNQPGEAVGNQGEALSNLREGTQSMMESMMEANGEQGESGNPQGQRDPLGRPQRTEGPDLGNTVKVPDEIDVQRAREILQELRRRLSEPTRPKIERDYLERLITPY